MFGELVQRVRTSVRMTPKVDGSNPSFPTISPAREGIVKHSKPLNNAQRNCSHRIGDRVSLLDVVQKGK